jgi:hypothetical protein
MDDRERDIRNVILLLVKAHKMRQSHAAALRVLCQAAADESASRQVTTFDLQKELPRILKQTDPVADLEAAQVETALNGEGEFLDALRLYASRQFWNPRPKGTLM